MGQHKNLVIRSSLCNRNVVTYHSIDHDRHHKNGKTYALYFCPDAAGFIGSLSQNLLTSACRPFWLILKFPQQSGND